MMDEAKKNAYRWLLYQGMLEIRGHASQMRHCWSMYNPLNWKHFRSRAERSAEVADALHNLAMFAALDFEGFDDDSFWERISRLKKIQPNWYDYRKHFEAKLEELREARKA